MAQRDPEVVEVVLEPAPDGGVVQPHAFEGPEQASVELPVDDPSGAEALRERSRRRPASVASLDQCDPTGDQRGYDRRQCWKWQGQLGHVHDAAGKLRGVLLQYPPRFVKSRAAVDELLTGYETAG